MKKLLTSILFLAAALTINAQDARQRTVETVVADVLAAMPANNASDFNTQMSDLAAAAPASVVETAKMMKPAGEGVKNNLYEYALTGLASYASANPQCVDKVREGFAQAVKVTTDSNNKAFLLNLSVRSPTLLTLSSSRNMSMTLPSHPRPLALSWIFREQRI